MKASIVSWIPSCGFNPKKTLNSTLPFEEPPQVWRLCFATELGILSARARVAWCSLGVRV